ncbi:MAG: DNA cytosine methyltransferase [Thermoleophilia bacterium]
MISDRAFVLSAPSYMMFSAMKCPTFIDLFSGAGGLACGLERAGLRSVWAVEIDSDAAATYQANFGHGVYSGPIEGVKSVPVGADVIVGGPPCQGFSPLGKMSPRSAHEEMNQLWRQYLRIVEMVRPRVFVVENVPEFIRSSEGLRMMALAEEWGYETVSGVLNAYHFGVPQKRRRGIIIASRVGKPQLPVGTDRRATVRDAIADLPLRPNDQDWHLARSPRPMSLERYRQVPPGGNRFDLMRKRPDITPKCWLNKPTGSTDVFGRLEWDKPALTIRTEFFKPEKGRYLHPEADRPITHREAMRLQTFPDDFIWVGSKISVARQVGNAVPPELARSIAFEVRALLGASIRVGRSAA